jgi:hypothetical protein
MKRLRAPARLELVALIALLLTFVAAPTPGDIGGCGQSAQQLDPGVFFASKNNIDCQRCQECGLTFTSCTKACDPNAAISDAFPDNCYPLVHDGEVCLRALYNASCSDYLRYMDDWSPDTPSECNFCPAQ